MVIPRNKKHLSTREFCRLAESYTGLESQVFRSLFSNVLCFSSFLLWPSQLFFGLAHASHSNFNAFVLLRKEMGRGKECLVLFLLFLSRKLFHLDCDIIGCCL